ncbi:hypothetical protein MANY_21190 [Mycolicibacterium anyangense]|uniref:Uncharacterized protein n=1 Tax=Mycolicibacterium anyangense TaxID=1431246 RepID=A0A6N4W9P2_9MYCO|nr:hypothetical protein MANY_21190 [Mycolicibacterium anyangense]
MFSPKITTRWWIGVVVLAVPTMVGLSAQDEAVRAKTDAAMTAVTREVSCHMGRAWSTGLSRS